VLWTVSRMVSTALATVPCTIAVISLAAEWGGGLYWLALAALLGIVGAPPTTPGSPGRDRPLRPDLYPAATARSSSSSKSNSSSAVRSRADSCRP
jgi:hypothetical protein